MSSFQSGHFAGVFGIWTSVSLLAMRLVKFKQPRTRRGYSRTPRVANYGASSYGLEKCFQTKNLSITYNGSHSHTQLPKMSGRGPGRPPRVREKSPSSTPVPSTEPATDGSQLPDAQWDAMTKVLNAIYDYRTEDGFDPSKLFHRKVNKRVIPEYYETIKEPMAMSTVKQKINTRVYHSFADFVRDFALIPHNAQVFNVPDSGAFQDALVIKEQLEKQLQLLVKDGIITQEVAPLPDLGEIPTYENVPLEDGEGDDDEESDEEGDEDEEDEGDEEEDGRKKRKRGRPSLAKRGDGDGKRSRGRPPKLLTPMEARIHAILRGLRRPRNDDHQLLIRHFDRLPDKAAMPEYYVEIRNPIAYDILKRKVKRKKYRTLEDFVSDVNLMWNNAKLYNTDESEIYQDADMLQKETNRLYEEERAKPDDTFVDEEGKIPMPAGILHNGELYKVGDWVHIQNPNDLTKPIPAQIYRTYKNPNGQSVVNACWYYRPEQTVHRFDKRFFPNEVVKTGRYKDHQIEEVEGKCFIMFYTRFFKGRPRNLPEGTEVYVCQARYNETQHHFNTIKTWASCLPDEVRDKDYEMDLFDHPRKMKKYASPISYLLRDDQKETDDFPKVQWGADGAPPKIGAVHRRPRNEKDSPPPEPTPPPPPKLPTPPPRQVPPTPQTHTPSVPQQQQLPRPPSSNARPAYPPTYSQNHQPHIPSPVPPRPPSTHQFNYQPSTPQQPQAMPPRPIQPPQPSYHPSPSHGIPPVPQAPYAPRPPSANYRDPPPVEVYTLPDAANLSIPFAIREQYQRDDFGHVLFFTVPPVAATKQDRAGSARGHSVRYLAEKARRAEMAANKKHRLLDNAPDGIEAHPRKIERLASDQDEQNELQRIQRQAIDMMNRQLADSVRADFTDDDFRALSQMQLTTEQRNSAAEESEKRRMEKRKIVLKNEFFADDWDPRIGS